MQDRQQNIPGQLEPIEDTAASQTGADPTQPASIFPWHLSSRSRDDVLMTVSGNGRRGRGAWLLGAAFVAVFASGWIAGANWHRFSDLEAAFNLPTQKVTYLRHLPYSETKPADADAKSAVRKTVSTTGSLGTQPAGASPRTAPVVPANSNAASLPPREPLVAVPETRPTTIEGWTVREVRGATAILEGPDGVWTVTRGDTVPGIGRIDSIVRWGSRWIVATANGLIATQ
jgi:hypothetical protein